MQTITSSIVGEFFAEGYVEALVAVRQGPSLRVCVRIPDSRAKAAALSRADALLPTLISELGNIEAAVNRATGQNTGALVFDTWFEINGSVSFTCGFLEGELEGELFRVSKQHGAYCVHQVT